MKLGITGANGRMGIELLKESFKHEGVILTAASVRPFSKYINQDIAALLHIPPTGITISSDIAQLCHISDVVVDFTTPEVSLQHVAEAAKQRTACVVGTTGFTAEQFKHLRDFGKVIPLLWSANTSIGVNLLLKLVDMASRSIDQHFDIEIVETHHRHKADSPSGTALAIGAVAASARKIDLATHSIPARSGMVGPRTSGNIGFSSVRGGDVVGDHSVFFLGDHEKLEISHKASNRVTFATGAIKAATWLQDKPAGFYSMLDVL
jgi:4-hydroxy-tetrahydrodipicolinate reductase